MRKYLALLVVVVVLSACCAPKARPKEANDVTTVRANKTFRLTMHADTDFSDAGRARITHAARAWYELTSGNVDINIVFDLDFESLSSLKEHEHDSRIIGVLESYPVVRELDRQFRTTQIKPLAATALADRTPLVFLIMDRILTSQFETVVMHELGHVAGLPDLPTYGAIMSGVQVNGIAPPDIFQHEDRVLCRRFLYCD